jgi:hypothetical protein
MSRRVELYQFYAITMTQSSDFPYWETPVQQDNSEIGRLNQMLATPAPVPQLPPAASAPGQALSLPGKSLTLTITTESARLDITYTPL